MEIGWILGIFFLVTFLGIAPMVLLIVWVVRRSTRKQTSEEVDKVIAELREKAQSGLDEMKSWKNFTYDDFSVSMRYRYTKGFAHKMRGKIHSIRNEGMVSFARYERGLYADGYLIGATDAFEYFYKIEKGKKFEVHLNGELLGTIIDGVIADANGKEIGHARHPVKVSVEIGFLQARKGDVVFPLTMNGRRLANIMVAPNHADIGGDGLSLSINENNWGVQTLRNVDNPTEQEEKWLIAMAILETAFHGHWMI